MSKTEIEEHVDNSMDQGKITTDPYEADRAKKDEAEKAQNKEFMSADEKFTSEEDNADFDIDKMAEQLRSQVKMDYNESQAEMRKKSSKSRDGLYAQDTSGVDSGSDIKSGDEAVDSIGSKFDTVSDGLFDNVYDEMNPRLTKEEDSSKTPMAKMEDDLEKQWEFMEQMGNELMYGASSTRKSVLAKEFLREQHVERLIPKRFLENLHKFETPKLEHESVCYIFFSSNLSRLKESGKIMKARKKSILTS